MNASVKPGLIPTYSELFTVLELCRESAGATRIGRYDHQGPTFCTWQTPHGAHIKINMFHTSVMSWMVRVECLGDSGAISGEVLNPPSLIPLDTSIGRKELVTYTKWLDEYWLAISKLPTGNHDPAGFLFPIVSRVEMMFSWKLDDDRWKLHVNDPASILLDSQPPEEPCAESDIGIMLEETAPQHTPPAELLAAWIDTQTGEPDIAALLLDMPAGFTHWRRNREFSDAGVLLGEWSASGFAERSACPSVHVVAQIVYGALCGFLVSRKLGRN